MASYRRYCQQKANRGCLMNNKVLITSVGWEPRFLGGLKDILSKDNQVTKIIFLHSLAFMDRTSEILRECTSPEVLDERTFSVVSVDPVDHVSSWKTIENAILSLPAQTNITLDITTMPRHFIWCCLHFIEKNKAKASVVYYRPTSYGSWLSGDNGRPKLIFRHSGIAYPDKPTSLVLFSGYDLERANQIVESLEPAKIILITQDGDQLGNIERQITKIAGRSDVVHKNLNAYAPVRQITDALAELVEDEIDRSNVIATSVGPRPSAIPLYMLNKKHPEIGLLYSQSHLYNIDYSAGIELSSKYFSELEF